MTLFSDSETFTRTRPTKITEAQREQMYKDIAQDIINKGFIESADEDIDEIISDLKAVDLKDTGFEIAKDLERQSCLYDFSPDFIEFLNDLLWREKEILTENVKQWVRVVNPQPKYKQGDKIEIVNAFSRSFNVGDIRYVMSVREIDATYSVSTEYPATKGTIIEYERLEENTKLITL